MTKLQLLHRALNERLMAAVEQIMEMVGGTVLEYEEETIRVRKENEVLRRRLRWMEGANPADWPGPSELVTLSTPDESNPALQEECAVSFGYDQDLEPVVIKTEPADIADDALFISPESSLTALPQGTDPGSAGAGVDFGLTDSVNWDSTTSYMAPLDFDPTLPTGVRRWRGGSKRQKMSFACPDCGKVFAKEKRLMFHMRVHSTERPYAYRRRKACFYGDNKRKRKVHSLTQLSKESVDDLSDGSEQTNRSGVSAERHILPIATPVEEQEQDSLSIAESDRTNGDKDPQNSTVKPVPIRHRRKGGRAKMPRCPQCSRVFTRPCRLAVHMKTHAMRKPLTNLPNKEPSGRDETAEKRKLYKKQSMKNNDSEVERARSEGQGLLSCPECKKVFARSCWLSFHMKTHVREKALLRKRLQTDMPVQTELSKEKNKEVVPENGGRTEVHTKKTEEVIKKVFPCPHCDKVFSREGWLKPHIRSHHLQKQNNRSGHLHNLPYHARTRSRRPVIQLQKGTSNAKGVTEELKRKTEESKTASKLKSSDEFSVINDVAKKITNEAIPSTDDHNRFTNESKRVPEELKQDTSDSDEEASQTKCLKERFECKMCNKVYMLEKRLRRHMKIHRGHKLGQDRKKWLIKKQLLKEMRHKEQKQAVASKSSHEKKPKKEEEKAADKKSTNNTNPENTPLMESEDSKIVKEKDIPGNCVCKYCGKAYARKNWLMLHMRGHLKEKAAADEMQKTEGNANKQIPQGSPNKQSFQKGKTRGQGSFPCPFCGKVFAWEMRFLMHMQIHSGEKPYSYRQRKKRFYGDLKRGKVPKVHNEEPLKENSEESEESAEEAMIDDRSAHLSSSPTLASAEAFTSGTETLESSQPVQTSTGSPGLLPQTAFEQPAGASTYSKGNQRTESVSDVISHFSLQPRIVLEPIMTETRYWNSPPRGPNVTPGGSERSGLELGQNSCPALVDEMVHVMEDQIIGYNLCTLPVEHSTHGNQNDPGKGYNVISVTDDTEIVCVEVGSPHHVSQMEEELHNMEVQQVSDSFEGNNIGGHQKEVLSYPDVPENSAIDQIPLIVIDDEPEQPVTKTSTIEKSLESPSTTEHNGEGIPTIKSALIQQTTVSESVEPSTHPESSCVVLSDDDNNDYFDDHVLCPSETSDQQTTASLASIQKEKDNKDVSSSIKPPSNVESVIKSLQIDSQILASDAAVSTKADDLACFQIETSDSTSQQIVDADLECVMSERKDRTSAGVTQTEDRSMSQKMPCQTCDSIFDGLASLSEHMQVHADKCLPDISDDRLNKKQDVNNQMSESGGDDSADNSEISGKSDISKQNVKTNESSLNKAEPFVKSSEESGVPSDSVTTSQSSKCSAKTAASSGEQKNLKESLYCRFCGKACRKLELHLKRDHMKEHEVVKALSLDKNSEERKRLLNSFAVKKNFKHHRGSKRDHDEDEVVHCIFCQGSYQRKHFREHALTCEQKQPEQIKSSAISSETEETLDTELRNPISDIISSSRLQSLSESSNALSSDINVSTPQITSDLGEHPFPDPIVHWKCDVEPLSPPTLESCPNAEQKAYHLEAERPLISAPKDLDAESLSPPNLDACHSTAVNPPHLESEISLILNAGSSALQNLDAELLEPPILDSCKGTPEQESTVTIPPILNIGSNILQQSPVKDHPQHGVESGVVQQPTSPAPEISSVLNIGSPNKQHAPQEIKVCSPHNTGDSEVLEPSSQPKEPLTAGPASSIDSSSTPNPESNSPPDLASCSDDAEQTIDSVVERNLFMNSSSSDVQLVPNLKPKSHTIPDPDSCTKEQTPDPQPEIIGSLEPRKSGHQPTVDPELKSNPPLQDIKLRVHEPTSDSESHGCDFHEDPDETVGGTGSDSAVKTQCDSSTSVTSKYKRKRDNQNSSVKEVSKKSHHLQLLADKNALSPSSAEKTSECQTNSWDEKSKLSKINYCFYCKEPHHKMTVHLEAAHPNEPEVAKALSFDKNSKERIKLLRRLQNKGNVLHKTHMAQSSEQDAQPFTEFKTVSSLEDDVICIHCSGLFSKKTFGTHLEQCRGRFSGSAETSCNQVLPNVGPISSSPKPQDPPSNSEQTDAKLESSSFHFVNTTCNTEQLNADPQLGSSSRKDLSCSVEDLDAVVNENVGEDLEPVNADLKLAYSPKENVSADLNSVNSSKESAGHTGVQVSDQEPGNSCRSLTQCDVDQQKAITPTLESSFITAHPESEDALENACKDFSPSHNPYDTSKSKVNAQTHETGRRGRRKKSSHVQNQLLNMDDDFLDEGKSVTPNSKVHACKHCRATFCSPYTLRRHEYTHTGERPFWCHQCNMGFIQKYRLVKHTITYHGDTSLSVDQGKLKRGTRRVHGETSVEDEDNNEKSDRNPEDLPNAVNKCTEQNVASTNQEV